MSYTHFTTDERKSLEEFKKEGISIREMARRLDRSPSSISREFKRNSNKNGVYNHWRAYSLNIYRRRKGNRQKLHEGTYEWEYIVDKLKLYWSPEQIVMRYEKEHGEKPASVKTIYNYIASGKFPKISRKEHLRRRGKRRYSRNNNYNTIHPERIIPEWSEEIVTRSRIGDWEGDTVLGAVGKGGVITLVDRKTRYLLSALIKNKTADITENAIIEPLKGVPVKSLSLDNGSEFANFKAIEKKIKAPIYFAEPHKPWQRGTNENTNDILRFFFPKGTDFTMVSNEDLQLAVFLINTRPRKCLGWLSPFEAFWGVALD